VFNVAESVKANKNTAEVSRSALYDRRN